MVGVDSVGQMACFYAVISTINQFKLWCLAAKVVNSPRAASNFYLLKHFVGIQLSFGFPGLKPQGVRFSLVFSIDLLHLLAAANI